MASLFRKQKIFDRKGKAIEEEYLYKDIPKLLTIQNNTKKKIAMDLDLLENFLLEDNNKKPDIIPHFNINCETLVQKNQRVKWLFNKHISDNKKRIIEVLETACVSKDYKMWDREVNAIRHLQQNINVDFALDDYPEGSSNLENIRHKVIRGLKIDRLFWDSIFERYNAQNRLDVLDRAFQIWMKKALKNNIKVITIEGIETKEQREFIKQIKTPDWFRLLWQWFYLHKPE